MPETASTATTATKVCELKVDIWAHSLPLASAPAPKETECHKKRHINTPGACGLSWELLTRTKFTIFSLLVHFLYFFLSVFCRFFFFFYQISSHHWLFVGRQVISIISMLRVTGKADPIRRMSCDPLVPMKAISRVWFLKHDFPSADSDQTWLLGGRHVLCGLTPLWTGLPRSQCLICTMACHLQIKSFLIWRLDQVPY